MFDILINPRSGKGKSLAALKTVETILIGKQIPYEVHKTSYAGEATEIVRKLNEEKEDCRLIVMGGDGTFNEALNGITDFSRITLGFIPCGTGNDYVKATSIPGNPKDALEVILKGETGYTDFIQLDTKRALNAAGAGMDVDVLVRYSTMKAFSGKAKYYASLLDVLAHLRFHKMLMELDGVKTEKSVFIVSVANGRYIGGGMPISPLSDVDDGYFDVVIVNEVKKRKIPLLLLKFLKGKHIDEPCTEHFRAKEIKVTLLDDGKTQVDGEVFESKVLHCTLVHETLKIYK